MSAVRLVRSSTLTPDVDYAYASVVPAGTRLVHLAGACPLDAEGRTVAPGDHAAQARQVVANLVHALADVGATLTDVAYTRVLVASADRADLVAVWRVVRDAFGEHDVPSTLLGVTVLGYPDQLVEVEAVAALPEEPSARP
jgi:enamine deaminase RidA (YjgF/YER057c/UK114 family)